MKTCSVTLSGEKALTYPIHIGEGLLSHSNQWLAKHQADHIVIVTDQHVKKYYGNALLKHLKKKWRSSSSRCFSCRRSF